MIVPFLKLALRNLFTKPSTVPYPAVPSPAKANYRGRIAYDASKCVNCQMCIRVCSPGAITVTKEEVPGGENITYDFDMTSCTFCATCVEFCNTGAIKMTEDYHMVEEDPKKLIVSGTRFKSSVKGKLTVGEECVYCGLCAKNCPEEAITVDRKEKLWKVDHSACIKCGACIEKCPKKCLGFQ